MSIPDFQTIMLPLLQAAGDGSEHSTRGTVDLLSDSFALTDAERKELLPSGRQATFHNRVGWAITYLKKAGLLESTRRSHYRVTGRGLQVLADNPPRVDMKYLDQFPAFVAFRSKRNSSDAGTSSPQSLSRDEESDSNTPEEEIEAAHQRLRNELAEELLQQIMACSPEFFERLVVDLLLKMGYGGTRKDAGQAIGRSGDGGIDGIIKEDRLGLDAIYIQAKRWEGSVGRPEIQKFVGALQGQRARKGVFIWTGKALY